MPISNPEQPLQRVSKVYVAGSSAELERAEQAIALLESHGIAVTSTWPIVVRDQGNANPTQAPRDQRQHWSIVDLHQVRDADLLWMLVPDRAAPTRGAWLEAGYALARGKVVIFSGADTTQSIFCALGYEFADDAKALSLILRIFDADHAQAMQNGAEIEAARREVEHWKVTARMLATRLRNLRGVDDPDLSRVIDDGQPLDATFEVSRG